MRLLARCVQVALLLGAAGGACAGDIIRCVAANGAVTYQQVACPEPSREQATNISNDYPPVNLAERERLLAREAEMYQRLEAGRDRLVQEAILREARADREARAREAQPAAVEAQPYYIGWPARVTRPVPHRRIARPGSQPSWTGGNPLSPGFSR